MTGNVNEVRMVYERLWSEASAAFERGQPQLDPFLQPGSEDRRRGLTLVCRPDNAVRGRVTEFLDKASSLASGQYFYRPHEFHSTVFSVIPVSAAWEKFAIKLPEYIAVLDAVLKNRPVFSIKFHGVTASPEAILIQGFPNSDTLARLRNDLRLALHRHGLGENLERRYKLTASHLSVVRFSAPMPDWKPLKAFLASHRETDFGETQVHSLQAIEANWYAAAKTLRTLREYPLSHAPA